ncbi:branched-chain amino acid ABC transporter permease [Aureimonas jatrophae]|uniref:Amino acid/amide ABC transporter membrane protein 2, HAAT family n=1 Tax=Aureimonas jatrophae TaxID=1166073 RepID=A0A1H0EH53_9HYPH|nr:branched-chain amino acid ABC transporter permease [Aureimonas jatrophae]MBB3952836.1 branched-chain amino acid transport system permease protein [Aureimonas jatrophae]SDN81703.1 amino acid/amide ABC transporter membrane protein 2, HAAT family [Aureimonas jatrophae]
MSVDATTAMSVPLLQSRYADRRLHLALFAVLGVLLLAAPLVVYPVFLMKILCFALFASAFNLLLGFGGLLSFGHAAFFGMAAYVSAHVSTRWGTSAEVSVLLGAAVAALLGLVIGSISIRRQGIYFAMVTLAFAQMIFFFALQAPFTGGEDGIQRVPRGALFGFFDISADLPFYYFVAAVTFACLVLIYRAIHSPFGQVLKAIRDNENRAISLGYRAERYKLLCFVLSSTLAGVAGGLKALVFQLASLTDVAWQMSGEVVLMTLLGGVGTIFGPLIGAALIVSMQNYLAELGAWVTIIQGGIFVLCVLLFRKGIVGVLAKLTRRPL